VSVSVAVTVTFGMTEPLGSVTIPEMLPVMLAYATVEPNTSIVTKAGRDLRRIHILAPLLKSVSLRGCNSAWSQLFRAFLSLGEKSS
jgi:nitrate reductase assembly molybdenum cofactor insertion protein NarJ